MVAQELLKRDHETSVACCKDILKNVPANAILISSNKAHFNFCQEAKFSLLVRK